MMGECVCHGFYYDGMYWMVVYYESLNRELKTKPINECRCDERLKTRVEESTRLG